MKNYTVTWFIFYQYKDWGLHVFCILYYNTGNWSSSTTRQIVSILFIHWNQITTLMMVTKIITTRTNRTPAFWDTPTLPHDYPYQWFKSDPKSKQDKVKVTLFKKLPKIQIFKFYKKLQTRHTFWGCLVPCINMKWIQPELKVLQSGHGMRDGRTDRRTDGVKPIYPPPPPPTTLLCLGYNYDDDNNDKND